MRKPTYPDVLHIWDFTWTKRGDVWEGPPTSDPTPYLPSRTIRKALRASGGRDESPHLDGELVGRRDHDLARAISHAGETLMSRSRWALVLLLALASPVLAGPVRCTTYEG
jgi:hypothetical protein